MDAPADAASDVPTAPPDAAADASPDAVGSDGAPGAAADAATAPFTSYPGVGGDGTSVGYLGSESALTAVDATHVPPGCLWGPQGYLRIQDPNVSLDHVYIHGGIDVYGGGTFHLSNSVVEGGWGSDHSFIVRCGRVDGAHCDIEDSTLRFKAGVAWTGTGTAALTILADIGLTVRNDDISGAGCGVATGSSQPSLLEHNWVHDLQTVTDNSIHQNAVFNFGGTGRVTIAYNRFVASVCPTCSTASVFSQPDAEGNTLDIVGNYIDGGGSSLYLETGTTATVRNNVVGPDHLYGLCVLTGTVTIVDWSGNTRGDAAGHNVGTPVLHPGDC